MAALLYSVAGAAAPAAIPDFQRAFDEHLGRGTLLQYSTGKAFQEAGLGQRFRDAVAALPAVTADGLSLEFKVSPGRPPVIGKPVEFEFWLVNGSDRDLSLPVRGSCRTVHAVGVVVIDPDGQAQDWIGRGLGGGPHCFCRQINAVVRARSRVKLDSTLADELTAQPWKPNKPGKHIVIGQYTLPNMPGKRLQTKPFVVDIPPA